MLLCNVHICTNTDGNVTNGAAVEVLREENGSEHHTALKEKSLLGQSAVTFGEYPCCIYAFGHANCRSNCSVSCFFT